VNFFGHAVFASWTRASAGYVLGSMVPDFANMIGAREPRAIAPGVAEGIRFHHATDAVFHDASTFRELQSQARSALRALGLSRPGALAVGHIGVEMLLDAALAQDHGGVRGYLGALEVAQAGDSVDWNDAPANERYRTLCDVLSRRGVTPGAADPAAIAYRVARALSSRPRLALQDGGERIVADWAEGASATIGDRAASLVHEVASALAVRGHLVEIPATFA
jgi:hypothetical protein